MTKIDPAFDPKTETWFVTEPCKCEAPTLRELKRDLRHRYPTLRFDVPNYYPEGAPPTVWSGLPQERIHMPFQRARPLQKLPTRFAPKKRKPKAEVTEQMKEVKRAAAKERWKDKWPEGMSEALVKLRESGFSFGQIAKKLNITKNAAIGKFKRIVKHANG